MVVEEEEEEEEEMCNWWASLDLCDISWEMVNIFTADIKVQKLLFATVKVYFVNS